MTLTQKQIEKIHRALRPMFLLRRKLIDYHNEYCHKSTFSSEYAGLCIAMINAATTSEKNISEITGERPYINLIDFIDRYGIPTFEDIPKLYIASI